MLYLRAFQLYANLRNVEHPHFHAKIVYNFFFLFYPKFLPFHEFETPELRALGDQNFRMLSSLAKF